MRAMDYSGLEAGTRVQAESGGVYYAAEVVTVSAARKRAKAPVKVHFLGYGADYDEWVGSGRLRSKALRQAKDLREGTPKRKKRERSKLDKVVGSSAILDVDTDADIEYLTDVEGNWEYFLYFVSRSSILYWEGEERGAWGPGTLKLKPNSYFVFGGDAHDKGSGDIRFVKTFLSLKERYPRNVFNVLGNRDVNKLRFYNELQAGANKDPWKPYWPGADAPYDDYLKDKNLERDMASFIRWMLDCNMGCQVTTFGNRKHELALLYGKASDQDVIDSYRDSVDPHGSDPWVLDLLRVGHIGVILGDTLFVHAGLSDNILGTVPGLTRPADTKDLMPVKEWIQALNDWKEQQIKEFMERPGWRKEGDVMRRGGDGLIDYGVPKGDGMLKGGDCSVMYTYPFDNGNPHQFSEVVEVYLQQSNICRVCTGHQPHGDSPTVVRHPRTGLLALTCDTSYSDMSACKLFNAADNRGRAMTVLRLKGPCVFLKGILADGTEHHCMIHTDPAKDTQPDAMVGRQLSNGSWVKTVVHREGTVALKTKSDMIKSQCRLLAVVAHGRTIVKDMLPIGSALLMLKPEFQKPQDLFYFGLDSLQGQMLSRSVSISTSHCDEHGLVPTEYIGYEFDLNEFLKAKTYIFAINGVIKNIHCENAKRNSAVASDSGNMVNRLQADIISSINKLMEMGKRVVFVSNNSQKSRKDVRGDLEKLGLNLSGQPEEMALTSAYTCAWFCRRAQINRPFILCSDRGILDECRALGINDYVATINEDGTAKEEYLQVVDTESVQTLMQKHEGIDAVIVGWDRQLTSLKCAVAATHLKFSRDNTEDTPMPIISCSMDKGGVLGVLHGQFQNTPLVGNGSMATMITNSLGLGSDVIVDVGKPSDIVMAALKRPKAEDGFGLDFSEAVVVGDNLATDIELAHRAGMKSLLVLSGDTRGFDSVTEIEATSSQPTWVLNSFADVFRDRTKI